MRNSELSAATLVSILIAGSFLSDFAPQAGSFFPVLGGIVLLIILFSYDHEEVRTGWQSIGFGGVAGFCAALAIAPIPNILNATSESGTTTHAVTTHSMLRVLLWLAGTVVFALIDRARMGRRVSPTREHTALSYAPTQDPAPVRPVVPESALSFSSRPSSFVADTTSEQSISTPPVFTPATQPPLKEAVRPPASEPVISALPVTPDVPVVPAASQAPLPQAIELPPTGVGKPTTVYLNLLGQGIACLRTVQAEHLGRDFYRIVESEPEGENWEFHPGQVVRCRKQKLSNGKALVAYEEAPRAT